MTDPGPPHDHTAEQALIGAALLTTDTLTAPITGNDFYNPIHALIWAAATHLHDRGQPVDPLLVAQHLARLGQLSKLPGGAAYLHTCIAACPSPSHAGHYAQIVTHHATARRLLELAEQLTKTALVDDPDRRTALIDDARNRLQHLTNGHRPNSRIRLTPASRFPIKAVRWVWEGRMPLGEITLIPGREGVGKSTMLAWMAAAITNGNLPGLYQDQPRAVLYAASEDAWSYTIAPRMLAAGANLDLIYRIDIEQDDGTVGGLILPRDCRDIPDIAHQVSAAALMCDPIMSLVDADINNFKAQELRQALEPLRRAAEAAGLAVPALVHFNKGTGGDVNTLIAGSRAWVEVARAVIAIAQDKDADDYTCVVSQAKNNLGRADLPNLLYTIDSVQVDTDDPDEPAHVGRLRWVGETDTTVEDLLSGTQDSPLSETTVSIIDYIASVGYAITAQEITDHFEGAIKYDTVRKSLARCAKRGNLVSPARGLYTTPTTGKTTPTRTRNSPKTTPPLIPPVTSVPMSQPQVRDSEREKRVSQDNKDLVPSVPGTLGTLGTRDSSPAPAHARDTTTTPTPSITEPQQLELISCTVCYGPLTDTAGTGRHPQCHPTPDLGPVRP